MVKVVVLGTRGFPGVQGGVEAHCENLYPRLAALGCEIVVFTRTQYVNSAINEFKGVKLISLSCPRNKFLEAFGHTFKGVLAAKKLRPDILHIHAAGPSLFTPLARLLGMKVVITSHGPEHERKKWAGFPSYVLRLAEYLSCTCANRIISVSESNAERLSKKYKREVVILPNGVRIPEITKTDGALKQYGIEKNKYILAVGRFVPEKGFGDLIEAHNDKSLDSRFRGNDKWKLVIAGRADHEDEYSRGLKEQARQTPNVVLTGFLTGQPLAELYSHAGLFVLPSYYEGLPIALLEAMSYGLSCVVSDIPANREVGLPEERLFKAGDITALAGKISEYTEKPLNSEEKTLQIKSISDKYDWDKIAEKTLEVYKKAIGLSVKEKHI